MFHPGFPLNAKRADSRPRLEWACAKKNHTARYLFPFQHKNIQNNSISRLNSGRFSGNSRLAVNRCQYLSPQIGQVAQIEQHFLFTSCTDSPMRWFLLEYPPSPKAVFLYTVALDTFGKQPWKKRAVSSSMNHPMIHPSMFVPSKSP